MAGSTSQGCGMVARSMLSHHPPRNWIGWSVPVFMKRLSWLAASHFSIELSPWWLTFRIMAHGHLPSSQNVDLDHERASNVCTSVWLTVPPKMVVEFEVDVSHQRVSDPFSVTFVQKPPILPFFVWLKGGFLLYHCGYRQFFMWLTWSTQPKYQHRLSSSKHAATRTRTTHKERKSSGTTRLRDGSIDTIESGGGRRRTQTRSESHTNKGGGNTSTSNNNTTNNRVRRKRKNEEHEQDGNPNGTSSTTTKNIHEHDLREIER